MNGLRNGRQNHPLTRFEQYVSDKWGRPLGELSQLETQVALSDWQVSEMAARLSNGDRPVFSRIDWRAAVAAILGVLSVVVSLGIGIGIGVVRALGVGA